MSGRIGLFFDGTWNFPAARLPDDSEIATNVYRLWLGFGGHDLDPESSTIEAAQETSFGKIFYIRGVGTSGSALQEKVDGALGTGVLLRMAIAYAWFCKNYKIGDEILVFGFSRGAFTARSFSGLLDACGRQKSATTIPAAMSFVNRYLDGDRPGKSISVQFAGLFDTVGSTVERQQHHKLSPANVRHVRHALALDEKRRSFRPTYWNANGATEVSEAWFAGAHSNVGGGYVNKSLSNIAQFWVLKGAQHAGIPVNYYDFSGYDGERPGEGFIDSWLAWIKKLPPLIGHVAEATEIHRFTRQIAAGHRIHESVFEAMSILGNYMPVATINGSAIAPDMKDDLVAPWEFR